VPHIGWQDEDATRANGEDAVVALQLAGPGNNVLRLLCLIGVPAEATTRLDFEDDRRRCVRAVSAVGDEGPLPANRVVAITMELCARQVKRRYRVNTIPFRFESDRFCLAGTTSDTTSAAPIFMSRTLLAYT